MESTVRYKGFAIRVRVWRDPEMSGRYAIYEIRPLKGNPGVVSSVLAYEYFVSDQAAFEHGLARAKEWIDEYGWFERQHTAIYKKFDLRVSVWDQKEVSGGLNMKCEIVRTSSGKVIHTVTENTQFGSYQDALELGLRIGKAWIDEQAVA